MSRKIDKIDRRILEELQSDGRITNTELARRVNLSPTPCLERVRRLERDGYIEQYVALVNPHRLDASILVFVQVALDQTTPEVFDTFRAGVQDLPEVLECHMIAGGLDYLLKVRLKDMAAYRNFLGNSLVTLPGVKATHTYVVMEEVKTTTAIPVPE